MVAFRKRRLSRARHPSLVARRYVYRSTYGDQSVSIVQGRNDPHSRFALRESFVVRWLASEP